MGSSPGPDMTLRFGQIILWAFISPKIVITGITTSQHESEKVIWLTAKIYNLGINIQRVIVHWNLEP